MKTTLKTQTFNVGDRVRWLSQAGGCWKSKEGRIVQVVPRGKYPAKKYGVASRRDHESYIVEVERFSRSGKCLQPIFYWPIVSKLKRAK